MSKTKCIEIIIHVLNQAQPGRFLGLAPRSLVTTQTALIMLLLKPKRSSNYTTAILTSRLSIVTKCDARSKFLYTK